MKGPCEKECPYRSPTCHAECERYLTFAEERKRIYAEKMKARNAVDLHSERRRKSHNKWRKRKANNVK